jgi:hypothetical protein
MAIDPAARRSGRGTETLLGDRLGHRLFWNPVAAGAGKVNRRQVPMRSGMVFNSMLG